MLDASQEEIKNARDELSLQAKARFLFQREKRRLELLVVFQIDFGPSDMA